MDSAVIEKLINAGMTPDEIYEQAVKFKKAQEEKEKKAADAKYAAARKTALDGLIAYVELITGDKVDEKTRVGIDSDLRRLERTCKKINDDCDTDTAKLMKFLKEIGAL